jgi:hypothetical protein
MQATSSARFRIGLAIALLGSPTVVLAQEDFYKGRTIAFICGFGVGGGYDLYARLIARHLGRFIAGQPNVVVQNMEGAGSVRASNYVYGNAAKVSDARRQGRAVRSGTAAVDRRRRVIEWRRVHVAHQPDQDHRRREVA